MPRLLQEDEVGRFALLHGDEVVSVWDTYGEASQAGYEAFGRGTFAVKRIDARDLRHLSRRPVPKAP